MTEITQNINPEILERLAVGATEGEDMVLVTVRSGSDGVSQQSVARGWVKKHHGVKHADILNVEYAGWDSFNRIMLVTWRTHDE